MDKIMQTKHPCVLIHICTNGDVVAVKLVYTLKVFVLTVIKWCFFCGSFLLFMFFVCHALLSVHCSLVVTCWERADHMALLYVMFYCAFVTFICGVLD